MSASDSWDEVSDPWTRRVRWDSLRAMGRAPMAIELLTLGGFVLSAGFFTAALDEEPPPLDKTRWGCLALSGAVLCVALLVHASKWATMLSSLAFLMSLFAVMLAAYAV